MNISKSSQFKTTSIINNLEQDINPNSASLGVVLIINSNITQNSPEAPPLDHLPLPSPLPVPPPAPYPHW